MKFILITSDNLPVYCREGLPHGYKGELLPGSIEGAEGKFGLIVLQEKDSSGQKARLHFFHVLKNIFIRHEFPKAFLQALFALGEDIIYNVEGHGKIKLRKGEYMMMPAPGKNLTAELLSGADFKIFEAVYTEEALRNMNGLFPILQTVLYDEHGIWKPEAREAGYKVREVLHELMNHNLVDAISENVYYQEQLRRLAFLMITQGDAVAGKRLYSDKEAALQMQEHLIRDINHPPKTKTLAEKLQMSINRASTIFRKIFGTGPGKYVQKVKMDIAYTEVTTTNKPIKVIAAELGFKRSQSFATKFKKRYGKSPKDLRDEIYKGEN